MSLWRILRDDPGMVVETSMWLTVLLTRRAIFTFTLLGIAIVGIGRVTDDLAGDPSLWVYVSTVLAMLFVLAIDFTLWAYRIRPEAALERPDEPRTDLSGTMATVVAESDVIDTDRAEQWQSVRPTASELRGLVLVGIGTPVVGATVLFYAHNPLTPYGVSLGAIAVLHAVSRSSVEPIRPLSTHVARSLYGVLGALPFAIAAAMTLRLVDSRLLDANPGLSSLSAGLVVAVPVLCVVSLYCLLLAYDGWRFSGPVDSTPRDQDEPSEHGGDTVLLGTFAVQLPAYALGIVVLTDWSSTVAAAIVGLTLLMVGLPVWAGFLTSEDVDSAGLVSGIVGAILSVVVLLAGQSVSLRGTSVTQEFWVPVALLVGFATGILVYATVDSRARSTSRSG